jgi:hypothetical protein
MPPNAMKTDFHLSQAAAAALLADFRHRRDVADANERYQEAAAWGEASRLLADAQLAEFNRRADARTKRRAAKQDRWIAANAKPAAAFAAAL